MRLIFDQNLSPRLIDILGDSFPESIHVRQIGLESATDEILWAYAKDHGYTIVSKDSDFRQMSFLTGHPPKVIWIRRGNCSTNEIAAILRFHAENILRFSEDSEASFLAVS